ncbi:MULTISPECIES: serine hydrolase [unclassified Streptomyces]|uniref:serine hydrolase n=1 Tax=unclassified Streptomyces TaxID=2593676 RepID=UPI0033A8C89B|nr:class A beta-lactamase-related serine hydrolase [Streptomyces sp. NBC_01176]
MPNQPRPPQHAESPAGHRGRRAFAGAGVLLALSTALLAGGTAHAAPAAAAVARPSEQTGAETGPPAMAEPRHTTRVTAAVLDLDGTGRVPTVYGDDVTYDTASIIKVDILATLLLQAQDEGRRLTAQERARAEPMIRHSDNAAANALWREIGRAPGLEAANKRLGLTETKGGSGTRWGLTRTTVSDQIRLLRAVFGTGGKSDGGATALNQESRTYVRTLMAGVATEQAWGVSAAGGSGAALKNGWLQRSTSGLWDVNSVGRIVVDGHHYLVAVLSDGSTSMKDGVALVERAARAALTSASGH